MNKWKTKFSHWKFDKKILLLVTVSILIVTLTVAGVSLTFSIASMKEQSVELLQMQSSCANAPLLTKNIEFFFNLFSGCTKANKVNFSVLSIS